MPIFLTFPDTRWHHSAHFATSSGESSTSTSSATAHHLTHIVLQACRFRDEFSRFTQAGAAVFGISSDSPEENIAFAKANNLPFPLLTDQNSILRKVCECVCVCVCVRGRDMSGCRGGCNRVYVEVVQPVLTAPWGSHCDPNGGCGCTAPSLQCHTQSQHKLGFQFPQMRSN